MHHTFKGGLLALAGALLLSACGGGSDDPYADLPAVSRIDVLSSTARGMESVVVKDGSAYVSLGNTLTEGTAVLKASLPLTSGSSWTPVPLGDCALGPVGEYIVRSPRLRLAGDTMWLIQHYDEGASPGVKEHAACTLAPKASAFVPRDQGLNACAGGLCTTLWMTDLKAVGTRLYSNAGSAENVLSSDDGGASWRVVRGRFEAGFGCTHSSFHVVGDRLLVGGECPLDDAFLNAYRLRDGAPLDSADQLPVTTPELENRNIQFIESIPNTQRVFVGVEGGLLRSEDGGKSFKFVIHNPIDGKNYPYIKSFLSLKGQPETIVVGGFDKVNYRPYLAFSRDGGTTWTDLSALLPNYKAPTGPNGEHGLVTDLDEDPEGRIILTYNEYFETRGRLLQLTLGRR